MFTLRNTLYDAMLRDFRFYISRLRCFRISSISVASLQFSSYELAKILTPLTSVSNP